MKSLKCLESKSIQPLWSGTPNWAQVHPFCFGHPWDVSKTWMESTCDQLNWLDMILKETHFSISGPTVDSSCQSRNSKMKSKELSVELRDRIVRRYRSGEGYKTISRVLKVPKSTVSSIIRKWNDPDSTQNWLSDQASELSCAACGCWLHHFLVAWLCC